jgi:hypothetical protein
MGAGRPAPSADGRQNSPAAKRGARERDEQITCSLYHKTHVIMRLNSPPPDSKPCLSMYRLTPGRYSSSSRRRTRSPEAIPCHGCELCSRRPDPAAQAWNTHTTHSTRHDSSTPPLPPMFSCLALPAWLHYCLHAFSHFRFRARLRA